MTVCESSGFGPVGDRRPFDGRDRINDLQINGNRQLNTKDLSFEEQGGNALKPIDEPWDLSLQTVFGKGVLLVVFRIHKGKHVLVAI